LSGPRMEKVKPDPTYKILLIVGLLLLLGVMAAARLWKCRSSNKKGDPSIRFTNMAFGVEPSEASVQLGAPPPSISAVGVDRRGGVGFDNPIFDSPRPTRMMCRADGRVGTSSGWESPDLTREGPQVGGHSTPKQIGKTGNKQNFPKSATEVSSSFEDDSNFVPGVDYKDKHRLIN